MTVAIDVASFILGLCLFVSGGYFCTDPSRTVDRFPGIILILLAIREVFFVIPNYPNKFVRLQGLEAWFLLFFEIIICAYSLATIYLKHQQRLLLKINKLHAPTRSVHNNR